MRRIITLLAVMIMAASTLVATEKTKYSIVGIDYMGEEKASLDLLTSRKLTRTELFFAARGVYEAADGYKYKIFFITWYLPGMKVGAGAWATTHFTPKLEVEIMDWMLEFNPPNAEFINN